VHTHKMQTQDDWYVVPGRGRVDKRALVRKAISDSERKEVDVMEKWVVGPDIVMVGLAEKGGR
jgi:hypothetical protein